VRKYEFLKKMYNSGKPFCVLLPTETLYHKNTASLLSKFGVNVIIILPHPKFIHEEILCSPCSTAYFIGNDTFSEVGKVKFLYHFKPTDVSTEVEEAEDIWTDVMDDEDDYEDAEEF
jgi:hypothetical protein